MAIQTVCVCTWVKIRSELYGCCGRRREAGLAFAAVAAFEENMANGHASSDVNYLPHD